MQIQKKKTVSKDSALIQSQTKEYTENAIASEEVNPFDKEKLQQAWNEITSSITNDKGKLYGILSSAALAVDEKTYLVTVNTLHKSHVDELEKINQLLKDGLITKLKNTHIQLKITYQANIKKEKVGFYTSEDKLDFLIKKNPELQKLIDTLNLQLSFN